MDCSTLVLASVTNEGRRAGFVAAKAKIWKQGMPLLQFAARSLRHFELREMLEKDLKIRELEGRQKVHAIVAPGEGSSRNILPTFLVVFSGASVLRWMHQQIFCPLSD